eukprot:14236733-Alexandrium_andersonii.AAC.1
MATETNPGTVKSLRAQADEQACRSCANAAPDEVAGPLGWAPPNLGVPWRQTMLEPTGRTNTG